MTVSELIKELKKMPQDLEVWTEGCGCWGTTVEVEEIKDERESLILIKRGNK